MELKPSPEKLAGEFVPGVLGVIVALMFNSWMEQRTKGC